MADGLGLQIILQAVNQAAAVFDEAQTSIAGVQEATDSLTASATAAGDALDGAFATVEPSAEAAAASLSTIDDAAAAAADSVSASMETIDTGITTIDDTATTAGASVQDMADTAIVSLDGISASSEAAAASVSAVGDSAAAAAAETTASMDEATASADGLESGIGGMGGAMALAGGAIAAMGIDKLVNNTLSAGTAIFDLQTKLGLTTAQAEQMNIALSETDTSSQTVTSTLMRLNKAVDTAGAKGNATTKAFEEFGINLDQFKSDNAEQQLDLLSQAYQNAGDNGEAFLATVLGPRGTQLAPMLATWTEAMQRAGQVKLAGIDPAQIEQENAQMQLLKDQFEQTEITLGAGLLPMITDLGTALSKNTSIITPLVIAIAAGATAFAAYTAAVKIADVATSIYTGIMANFDATMDANPIGLVVIGIMLLAAAAYEIITHWSQISAFFTGMWADISNAFQTGVNDAENFCTQLMTSITAAWNSILNFATQVWNNIKNAVVNAFSWMYNHNYYFKDLVDFITTAWNDISSITTVVWTAIEKVLTEAWTDITSAVTTAWKAIETFFSGIWNDIEGVFNQAWTSIVNAVGPAMNDVWTAIKGIWSNIASWFDSLASEAYQWGVNLIQGFINGIMSMINAVENAVKSVAQAAESFLGFHSPTEEGPGSTADQWAPAFIDMFTEGLLGGVNKVAAAANALMAPLSMSVTNVSSMAVAGGGGGGLTVQNYFQGMTIAQSQTESANLVSQGIWNKMKSLGKF